MHVGQQQGIDRACKSTPFQSLQAIRLLSSLSSRPHLYMIVYIAGKSVVWEICLQLDHYWAAV